MLQRALPEQNKSGTFGSRRLLEGWNVPLGLCAMYSPRVGLHLMWCASDVCVLGGWWQELACAAASGPTRVFFSVLGCDHGLVLAASCKKIVPQQYIHRTFVCCFAIELGLIYKTCPVDVFNRSRQQRV